MNKPTLKSKVLGSILISDKSDRYGDKLIALLDFYNAVGLREITPTQAKDFYKNVLD